MESTYGNRLHPNVSPDVMLAEVIHEVHKRRSNLLIPSFAVGRVQELLLMINHLKQKQAIPEIPIYLDTPMGANATEVYFHNMTWHKLSHAECTAMMKGVTVVRDYQQTLHLSNEEGPKIIIAGSGMLTGGRALTYLKIYLGDEKNIILLAGYQAEGTRGRSIQDGAHEIKIDGEYYQVKSEVKEIASMSAHADQKEMIDWLRKIKKKPRKIFLVHGETAVQQAFRVKIEKEFSSQVVIPEEGQEFEI